MKNNYLFFRKTLKQHYQVVICFCLMFFFGSMLLTIGYTNPQIARQLFGNNKSAAYQLLPAVPQALGLVVASTSLKSLFARVNIR